MLSDLMVEPVSIACRGQQRHQCEYTDQCQFITFYLLRIRIHIHCQIILLFSFRNEAMACFELHSKHMRIQLQVRGGRRCLPPTRYSDSAYDPGGSSVSRKEIEENQRKGRINLTNIISHVGLRPGIGVS